MARYVALLDKRNRAKHGISLGEAARLDWDAMLEKPDLRRDYGEERWIGYAPALLRGVRRA